MKISARNALKGMIKSIEKGEINSEVIIDVGRGILISSVITVNAVEKLNLIEGKEVYAVIKSSEVMIAVD
jgi:molybdopterin-binding protein